MTVTEERPEVVAETETEEAANPYEATGFAGALSTGDHKALGRMYVVFGLVGGLLAFVLNFMVSLERTQIDSVSVLDWGGDINQTFFQAWSLSRTSLLFFCVVPLILGLATYIVPLQVGAPSIAFPRAAAAAFWAWVIGMGIHVATVFVDGGVGRPELPEGFTQVQGPDPEAAELSVLSIGMVSIAVLLAAICIMVTVVTQRPEGMTLYDVPLFSWSMLVAGGVWLLSIPVWLANLAIIWGDFRGTDAQLFGQVEQMWGQVGWLWLQPMIFAFAIPVLGIVGEIVPVAVGKRQRGYWVQQASIASLGMLSFGAWVQPYFNPNVTQQALFVVMGLLLIVPILSFFGGLSDTLVKGTPKLTAHFIVGMLAMITLITAAATAALHVLGPALGVVREIDEDWLSGLIDPLEDLQGTVIATAVMQFALVAAVMGAIAGLYYWGPKMFGRTLLAPVGILGGLTVFGGAMVLGIANVVNGFLDEGDHVYLPNAYDDVWDSGAVETFNVIGAIGALLLIAGLALVVVDVLAALFRGVDEDEDMSDPWDGHTLEWATTSPPPIGNFDVAPVVFSEAPLLDVRDAADDEAEV
ncbi:MAG: cbb3-type cytochrome c oxidase subunit I [Acidimicrobiales bacterium]